MGAMKSIPLVGEVVTVADCSIKLAAAGCAAPFNIKATLGLLQSALDSYTDYTERSPVYATGISIAAACGDRQAQKHLEETWTKVGLSSLELLDGFPVVGHVKGTVHYIMGQKDEGDQCMKAASRSLAVTVAMVATGGAGVPLAAAAIVGTGLTMDVVTTGVDSAIHQELRPSGHCASVNQILVSKNKAGAIADAIIGFAAETGAAVLAANAAKKAFAKKQNTARTYRVMDSSEATKAVQDQKLNPAYKAGTGKLGETWISESPEHAKTYMRKQQSQLIMKGSKVKMETVQFNVDKSYLKDMKATAPHATASAANQQAAISGGAVKNVFNTERLGNNPQGKVNFGIKNPNLAQLNKNVLSVKKINPNSWRYRNGVTKAISRHGGYVAKSNIIHEAGQSGVMSAGNNEEDCSYEVYCSAEKEYFVKSNVIYKADQLGVMSNGNNEEDSSYEAYYTAEEDCHDE